MRRILTFLVLIAVAVLAQQWQVELVDSSCRPADVFVKRASGWTYVAYLTGDGSIRIATKDSIWHYETLDTSFVRPDAGFHLALGPNGRMAVSGLDDSVRPVVIEKLDSGWGRIWTHEELTYASPLARAVYGANSALTVIYCDNHVWTADVIAETRLDSVWQVDTACHFVPPSNYQCASELIEADCNADAGPCFLVLYSYWFGPPTVPPSNYVIKGYRTSSGWSVGGLGGGFQAVVNAYDITAGRDDTARAAVYYDGYSRFDRDPVWSGGLRDAAVQVDNAGRALMAFVTQDGVLRFTFKTGFWHFYEIPDITTARCCDLALDEYDQPLIALEDAAGLHLAHGIDVVGMEEDLRLQAPGHKPEPTVLSGASVVKRLATNVFFDAMGRRVVNPRSGVYFVRETVGGGRSAAGMRKVVITK